MSIRASSLIVALCVLMTVVPCADICASSSNDDILVLFDFGNGDVLWSESDEGTLEQVTLTASDRADIEVSFDPVFSVNGVDSRNVGTQSCTWNLYVWDGGWTPVTYDRDDPVTDGCIAWGFYPSGEIVPSVTPEHRIAWTSFRGGSGMSGQSDSYGPRDAADSVEWYSTYSTGNVDCTVVYATGLLYHTTGGVYGSLGDESVPWVYCLDADDGNVVWKHRLSYGVGYEVTSPLVVGDLLIVSSSDGSLYCFDRFGDGNGGSVLLHSMTIESDFPLDGDGDIVWRGQTFTTGATNMVYDSGALYFGFCDGRIFSYSVDRTGFQKLWEYVPSSDIDNGEYVGKRGCFYYHSPTVVDVDFDGTLRRILFMGSYEGYAYAVDASTGEEVWVERMIDLGDDNVAHRGTPGSVASPIPTGDGRLLIVCTDGAMSSLRGYVVCVDASTGKGPSGSDYHWKTDALCTLPTITDDGFACYVSPSMGGSTSLEMSDGSYMDIGSVICRFDMNGKVMWCAYDGQSVRQYALIRAPLTMADGVLYAMDYSSGTQFPSGGCVHAVDADTGEHIWSVLVTPYSSNSYSMSMPTVIDGKVYVANDYGAVYCISDIAGESNPGNGEIDTLNDFSHWSWYLLIGSLILSVVIFIRLYR